MPRLLAGLAAVFTLAPAMPVDAGELKVSSIKASSTLATKDGESYTEDQLQDAKAGAYWAEGLPSAGMGTVLTVTFDGEVEFASMEIWNGCWQTADLWKRLYRVKDIELKFPDNSYERITVPDGQKKQVVALKTPKKTNLVRIVIKSVYSGTTFQDTAISELKFFDPGPRAEVTGLTAKASSELPAEADNLDKQAYAAAKAVDGFVDTYWCENKQGKGEPGHGVGEWLQVHLPSATPVSTMRVAIGNGFDEKSHKQNSRPVSVRAEFSDGTSRQIQLEDRPGLQDVPLGGKTLSWVKLTVEKVAEGTRWNDTAIAEVQFVR